MYIRKKSKLESFFSFNQHRKRLGASKINNGITGANLLALKEKMIEKDTVTYTHGADKNLSQHLDQLRAEFSGQSELLYYHAKIIVLIRRDYKSRENFNLFKSLWSSQTDFLLNNLNTRWLVSAADTFADYSQDPLEQALAVSTSLLVNTVKLYETERFINKSGPTNDTENSIKTLKTRRVDLFDGTSAFAIGTDDTIRNMRWRLDKVCNQNAILGKLLTEVFNRLQNHNTAYQRFKDKHSRKKTAWW